jgi:hypothetical protein
MPRTVHLPTIPFSLSSRQRPQLKSETVNTLLLNRDQIFPEGEKVEVWKGQMTSLLAVQLGNRVSGARLDPVDRLKVSC